MKQQILLAATLTLALSSTCLAHNGAHDHGHEGGERADLMREVGKLYEVTDATELEVRDGLAWLPGSKEPYSGWVRKTWEVRHRHEPSNHMHTHPKQTRLAKFKVGMPTQSLWLDKNDLLKSMTVFAGKEMQEDKAWVPNFLKAMNTGVGLFMILEGVEGEEPRGAQYMEWHENGTKKLESKILDYNEEGYRREDFTAWNQHNGQVGAQGQTWRRGSYVIDDGKIVRFYSNGQKRSEELWDYGKPVTMQVWKINGEKCPDTKLAEGTGIYVWYDQYRGTKEVVYNYMNGLLHGPTITYHRGEKTHERNWVSGKRQGIEIGYKADGSRIEVTHGGEQDGLQVQYNPDGSISKTLSRAESAQQITDKMEKQYGK
jgi:hypothetical protein